MKAVKKESKSKPTVSDGVAEKIEKKRENAKKRRLLMNARTAKEIDAEIEALRQKRPELTRERDELETMIAEKTLQKQLNLKKQEIKFLDFFICSKIKAKNRHLPKTKVSGSE